MDIKSYVVGEDSEQLERSQREENERLEMFLRWNEALTEHKASLIEEKTFENHWSLPLDTVQELLNELNRQINGVKDWHDLIVEKCIKGELKLCP